MAKTYRLQKTLFGDRWHLVTYSGDRAKISERFMELMAHAAQLRAEGKHAFRYRILGPNDELICQSGGY